MSGVGKEAFMLTWSMAVDSVRSMIRDVNRRMEKTIEWPRNGLDGLVDAQCYLKLLQYLRFGAVTVRQDQVSILFCARALKLSNPEPSLPPSMEASLNE